MDPQIRRRLFAGFLALTAAFLWSTYYLFVLYVGHTARPSAVLFYPFLGGGIAYAAWVVARGDGLRFGRVFGDPAAYVRVSLLLGMQVSVLAATYLTGPVDASLLSLLGDVVATPLLIAALVVANRPELAAPGFVAGIVLSLAGGSLAIVGGHGLEAVRGAAWLVVVGVPVTVAGYFVLSARAGTRTPLTVIVAQATAAGAVGSLAVAPLVPGGFSGIVAVGPLPLLLLLVNGFLSFFAAPLLYFRSIETVGLVFPPLLMTGIPVFTLFLSAAVLGLSPPFLGILGVPVAVAGGLIALVAGARHPPAP